MWLSLLLVFVSVKCILHVSTNLRGIRAVYRCTKLASISYVNLLSTAWECG